MKMGTRQERLKKVESVFSWHITDETAHLGRMDLVDIIRELLDHALSGQGEVSEEILATIEGMLHYEDGEE